MVEANRNGPLSRINGQRLAGSVVASAGTTVFLPMIKYCAKGTNILEGLQSCTKSYVVLQIDIKAEREGGESPDGPKQFYAFQSAQFLSQC